MCDQTGQKQVIAVRAWCHCSCCDYGLSVRYTNMYTLVRGITIENSCYFIFLHCLGSLAGIIFFQSRASFLSCRAGRMLKTMVNFIFCSRATFSSFRAVAKCKFFTSRAVAKCQF